MENGKESQMTTSLVPEPGQGWGCDVQAGPTLTLIGAPALPMFSHLPLLLPR